jgi:hypothetical protein
MTDKSVHTSGAVAPSVTFSLTNVVALAANPARRRLVINNTGNGICYIKFGPTASTGSYTYALAANGGFYETKTPGEYIGEIDAIWAAGTTSGGLVITELS